MATVQDIQKQAIATGDFSSKAMTDAYLAAGGTLTNGRIPSKVAVAGQDIRPISVEDLMTSRTPIVIPEPPEPSTAGAALAAGKARADSFQVPDLTQSEFEQQYGSVFKQGEELLGQTAEEAVAERNRASQEAANRRAAVARAQSELTNIQSQIQGFETQAKEEERALLRNAEGGLVTSAIFSRQRSKIQSQLAERVLPFQAQILAKQAEIQRLGGDAQAAEQLLADAKNQVNTLFQLKVKDNENYRNFKLDMYNKAWDYATEGQKQQLQARRDLEARNQQALNDAINDAQAWASKIFDTNPALASQIQRPDFTIDDPEFENKLAEYNRKVAEVVGQAEVKEKLPENGVEGILARQLGRQPTFAEIIEGERQLAEARREPEKIGGGFGSQLQLPNIDGAGTTGLFTPLATLTATQKLKVNTVVAGTDLINQAEKLYNDAVGSEYSGPGAGIVSRIKGLKRYIGGKVGTNQKWEAYRRFLDSNRAPIAKGIKGEVGNLAQQEQLNALKSFPGAGTSPFEASIAFEALRNQAQSNIRSLGELEIIRGDTAELPVGSTGATKSGMKWTIEQ